MGLPDGPGVVPRRLPAPLRAAYPSPTLWGERPMINRRLAVLVALFAPLAACVSGSDSTTPSPNPNSGFQARFAPLGAELPFPNDLFFNHFTGTLGIPLGSNQAANA